MTALTKDIVYRSIIKRQHFYAKLRTILISLFLGLLVPFFVVESVLVLGMILTTMSLLLISHYELVIAKQDEEFYLVKHLIQTQVSLNTTIEQNYATLYDTYSKLLSDYDEVWDYCLKLREYFAHNEKKEVLKHKN